MPAFYSSRPTASHMPITPPDSGSGYGYGTLYAQDPYSQQQSLSQPRNDGSYEYQQSYMQPAVAPAPPTYQYQQSTYQPANSLPPIQSYYEPMGAPILPPLRINESMSYAGDYQLRLQQEQQSAVAREQQRQAAKEEKSTGGVSAKLDYDMEKMTDFVTEATMTMMQNPPSFRKWVNQVLSATRLPSATILLSLYYLNDRVARFPASIDGSENYIYRLLAVALILGSKFLDDNTFINRSWCDVTAIKVKELNAMEREWLHMIDYSLHVDIEQPDGLEAWLRSWKDYKVKDTSKQQTLHRLSPLDTTNVHRHTAHRDRYSPYPSPYSAASARTYETPATSRSTHYTTPTYSSDPWASTEHQAFDDFYRRQNRYPTLTEIDDVNRRASEERARQSAYAYSQPTQSTYYQQPLSWSATTWNQPWNAAHSYDCTCEGCRYQQHYRPYPMQSSYSAQTVMG